MLTAHSVFSLQQSASNAEKFDYVSETPLLSNHVWFQPLCPWSDGTMSQCFAIDVNHMAISQFFVNILGYYQQGINVLTKEN